MSCSSPEVIDLKITAIHLITNCKRGLPPLQGHHLDLNRDAVEGRIDISLVGWRYFLSSPLIGVGVGNFVLLNEALTHNSYLSVLIEYGVVGASAWLGLLAWTAWRGLRLIAQSDAPEPRRLAIVCTSALAGLLIGGLAIEIESDKFVWLVIALLSALAMRLPHHVPPVAMRVVSADR